MIKQILKRFIIPETAQNLRLDQAVAALLPEYSRSKIKTWIENGDLLVDGQTLKPKEKVKGGEQIELTAELADESHHAPQAIPLNIVYEDDDLIVVNKPINMVVHPAAGNREGTLLNALLHHCPALSTLPRAGIIHRIDKNTSGLLVVAKTLTAQTALVKQLQAREISREYEAIVYGELTGGGRVDQPIGRHARNRLKMAVTESGKPAVTHYRIINRYQHFTHIKVKLETGRTHQIRVHMSHIHHPIVGDPLYDGRIKLPKNAPESFIQFLKQFKRQALHAKHLGLTHPTTGEWISWTAELPEDMQQLCNLLEENFKQKR